MEPLRLLLRVVHLRELQPAEVREGEEEAAVGEGEGVGVVAAEEGVIDTCVVSSERSSCRGNS